MKLRVLVILISVLWVRQVSDGWMSSMLYLPKTDAYPLAVKAEPRDHGITPPNGASHLGTSRADVGEMSRQAVINRGALVPSVKQ